jgi:hypothetical protein
VYHYDLPNLCPQVGCAQAIRSLSLASHSLAMGDASLQLVGGCASSNVADVMIFIISFLADTILERLSQLLHQGTDRHDA